MRETILRELEKIEESEGVKILHCVESGSRAWGFASPDSDYDVRFIYARPAEFYLKLENARDVIEWKLDDILDINGWDIKKTLQLLHASNPTLFEWSSSPVVYKTTDEWAKIAEIAGSFFLKKTGMHHYLHMAKKNFAEYLTAERVKLKKYFYVLRPILACMWILDRGTPPPMLFTELAESYLCEELKPRVGNLLEIKRNSPEINLIERDDILNDYIIASIAKIEQKLEFLPKEHERSWDELDKIFLEIIDN